MHHVLKRMAVIGVCVGSLAGCSHPAAPKGELLSGDATVTLAVECLALTIAGAQYQPIGLPDSLAVVGTRLRVEGRVERDGVSTCMIPILQLTAVARE